MPAAEKDLTVRVGFDDFEPLPTGTFEEKALHALNFIADAVGVLAKSQFEKSTTGM